MNMAQRMESSSCAGAIHVSNATSELLPEEKWQATGGVEVGMNAAYLRKSLFANKPRFAKESLLYSRTYFHGESHLSLERLNIVAGL